MNTNKQSTKELSQEESKFLAQLSQISKSQDLSLDEKRRNELFAALKENEKAAPILIFTQLKWAALFFLIIGIMSTQFDFSPKTNQTISNDIVLSWRSPEFSQKISSSRQRLNTLRARFSTSRKKSFGDRMKKLRNNFRNFEKNSII